ncbi:hypothetical protein [Nakamurella panacisegetis]|uniref:hypothetical protein n=1 Tax=Nakamurella panacisegetis TaxID=1090615 RepID=UPI0012FDEE8E|nr:hypothetical protein [Nakamurella panacisegetis]
MTLTSWAARRKFPLLATLALIVVAMSTSTVGADLIGQSSWSVPHDLWRTLVAGDRLRHWNVGGLYTQPTALVTFPGAALVLVPIVLVIDGAGLGLAFQTVHNPYPAAWLVAGPYEIALSASVLFAADRVAERFGATRPTRLLLALAGAVTLWSVSVRWGHPEDAVAVALFLYGALALADGRRARSAWLIGAAVAVQPLVLLAYPMVLVMLPRPKVIGYLVRSALPAVVLLGTAAAANWTATLRAVTSQPNFPSRNHPTPWTSLAPEMSNGAVAAGPGRLLAVVCAVACALVLARRLRGRAGSGVWDDAVLVEFLWWTAAALALRCVFETVMVAYYLWPVLIVALVAASRSRSRLVPVAVASAALTFLAEAPWHGPWIWWGAMTAGLAVVLAAARPAGRSTPEPAVAPTSDRTSAVAE